MKHVFTISFLILLSVTACKKTPVTPDQKINLVGKWEISQNKMDYYDAANNLVHTDEALTGILYEFDDKNCQSNNQTEAYSLSSSGGKTYILFAGLKVTWIQKIEISKFSQTTMTWTSQEYNAEYYQNGTKKMAAKGITTIVLVKK